MRGKWLGRVEKVGKKMVVGGIQKSVWHEKKIVATGGKIACGVPTSGTHRRVSNHTFPPLLHVEHEGKNARGE